MNPPTATSVLLLLIVLLPLAGAVFMSAAVADGPPAVYLVFVDPTPPGVTCMQFHLGILTVALGSEEKAKEAMIYNYKNVVNGFSARVTPSQLDAIKKQPQVNRVLPSVTLHLMSSKFNGVS
uniref:Uncharacterized protein n=1 Tax=Avena sativa TaxID=4498 RepID=A0ACD6AAB1_AVESA